MRFKSTMIIALSFMLFAAASRDAFALTFDRLQVRPYLDFSAVYDDNVFVEHSNPTDDFYFLISPGLLLGYGRTENRLELEYTAGIYRYARTGDANDVEDHSLRAAAILNFPGGLSLKLSNLARRGHEKRSEQNLAFVPSTQISRFWAEDFNAEAAYALSERFKVAFDYEFFLIGYNKESSKFRDMYENKAGASVFYKFLPKTSALVQGIYSRVYHYNVNAPSSSRFNSNEYWVLAGLTWEITAKSTGTVKGGYEWKNFDNPGTKDFSSGIYMVSLDHNFTPKTAVRVSGLRRAEETDDPEVPYYTTTNGSLELFFRPVSKIVIKPYASITGNRYSGESVIFGQRARRSDAVWSGGIGMDYHMNKWFTVGLDYKHTKRSSNITFYDYTDNTVMLTLSASI